MFGLDPIFLLHFATLILGVIILAIAIADFRTMRIPDLFSAALAVFGVVSISAIEGSIPAKNIVGAVLTGLVFWGMRTGYSKLRGRQGLGFGDVKMASASAVWISPWLLSTFLLIACVTCIVYSIAKGLFAGGETLQRRIPFGPFLGIGLVFTWLFERHYLTFLFK